MRFELETFGSSEFEQDDPIVEAFIAETAARYEAATGLQPSLYAVQASGGVQVGLPARGE